MASINIGNFKTLYKDPSWKIVEVDFFQFLNCGSTSDGHWACVLESSNRGCRTRATTNQPRPHREVGGEVKSREKRKISRDLDLAYIDMGQTLDLTAVSNLSKLQRFLYSEKLNEEN